MGTFAVFLTALVLGWLGTLCLARDLAHIEIKDFTISACGASCMGLVVLPQLGIAVWGEYGLRFTALLWMELAAVFVLILANLARGRGIRTGVASTAFRHHPNTPARADNRMLTGGSQ